MAHQRAVPPWAALNRLAHASCDELADLIESGEVSAAGGWVRPWSSSERILAFRVLSCAADRERVRDLQQSVLVPLELFLIERYKVEVMTVQQVFEAASEALDRHVLGR